MMTDKKVATWDDVISAVDMNGGHEILMPGTDPTNRIDTEGLGHFFVNIIAYTDNDEKSVLKFLHCCKTDKFMCNMQNLFITSASFLDKMMEFIPEDAGEFDELREHIIGYKSGITYDEPE